MPTKENIEEIYKQYKGKIYRLALGLSGNDRDAEDITQNTIIKIMNNLDSFRQQSKLSTWIYKIAYNEALMLLRKRYSQFNIANSLRRSTKDRRVGLYVNWPERGDKHLLDEEFKARLDDTISEMPIQYRMPLLLHFIEGMPLEEVAEILDLKLNSLKTRIHRSILMIKSHIIDYYKDKEEKLHKPSNHCQELTGFVYDYARGHLDKEKADYFDSHIKDCPKCSAFLHTYDKAIEITNALQCQDIPDDLHQKIDSLFFEFLRQK